MSDYRPLLPWFGVVLLGVFFGNVVYLAWRKKAPVTAPPGQGSARVSLRDPGQRHGPRRGYRGGGRYGKP
jgi:uncharacterized membrane protein